MKPALLAAQEISDYLCVGMHHMTPEGRAAIAEIIERHYEESLRVIHQEVHDGAYRAHADRIAELERQLKTPVISPRLKAASAEEIGKWNLTVMNGPQLAWFEMRAQDPT